MLATFFSLIGTIIISVIGGIIGGYLVLKYKDNFCELEEKISDCKARVKKFSSSRKKRVSRPDSEESSEFPEEFWPDPEDDDPDNFDDDFDDFDDVPDDNPHPVTSDDRVD